MENDNAVAGDPTAVPELLPPPREHPSRVAEFAALTRELAGAHEEWAPLVRYDATSRWYHRLRTGPGHEAWLLSWVPGQGSGLHDHGGSHGVFTVLRGVLTERGPGFPGRPLRPGTLRVVPAGHAHEVVNSALEPAVSLHVYHPGLTAMTRRAWAPVAPTVAAC